MAYLVAFADRVRRGGGGHGDRLPPGPLPFQRRRLVGAGVPPCLGGSYRRRAYDFGRPKLAIGHARRDGKDFRSGIATYHDGASGDEHERFHADNEPDDDDEHNHDCYGANLEHYGARDAHHCPPNPAALRTWLHSGVHGR
jgi:hypothetical protein